MLCVIINYNYDVIMFKFVLFGNSFNIVVFMRLIFIGCLLLVN